MSAHTPGPWKAHFEEAYFVTGPDFGRVAMMMNLKGAHGLGGRRTGDESAANCRLIAAAPELLEALLNALPYVEDVLADKDQLACFKPGVVQDHAKGIRAAIAKATGEKA